MAKTISNPDEIILNTETRGKKTNLVKKMFRYFKDEKGKTKGLVSMFEYQKDKTIGMTSYVVDNENQLRKRRTERLIYSKKKLNKSD